MDHKCKINFFSLTIDFFKDVNWFSFPSINLNLFHLFIQYGKNDLLKDFVLVGTDPIIEADDDLSKKCSWEEKAR